VKIVDEDQQPQPVQARRAHSDARTDGSTMPCRRRWVFAVDGGRFREFGDMGWLGRGRYLFIADRRAGHDSHRAAPMSFPQRSNSRYGDAGGRR